MAINGRALGLGAITPPGAWAIFDAQPNHHLEDPTPGVAEKRAGGVRAYRYISHTSPLPPLRFGKKQGISKNECV